MSAPRRIRLFRSGRHQFVHIPRDFELPGDEAILRKAGHRLILEPAPGRSLLDLLATLEPLDEALLPTRELPTDSVDFDNLP